MRRSTVGDPYNKCTWDLALISTRVNPAFLLAPLSHRWNRTSLWVIPPRSEHVADEDRARSSQIMSHAIRFGRRDSHHRRCRRAVHNGINMLRLCPALVLKASFVARGETSLGVAWLTWLCLPIRPALNGSCLPGHTVSRLLKLRAVISRCFLVVFTVT